jgi:hypothetical protein
MSADETPSASGVLRGSGSAARAMLPNSINAIVVMYFMAQSNFKCNSRKN